MLSLLWKIRNAAIMAAGAVAHTVQRHTEKDKYQWKR